MKIIDLEAHFYTRSYIEYLGKRKVVPREVVQGDIIKLWYDDKLWAPRSFQLQDRLLDLGEGRIKEMDAAGIDMQVISLTNPNVQLFEPEEGSRWAKIVNDEVSAVLKKHPDRFIGLATVAPQSPEGAADELERAVTDLGFKGVVIQSHSRNEYLDDKKYWCIFERAERLDVPIYIHPIVPATSIRGPFADYGYPLSGPILGFAVDVSLHVMRLIYSGLFDEYPNLKIILGHLGEGLPYWLPRLDFYWKKKWVDKPPPIGARPSEYLKKNFTVTTSGIFFQPAFMCSYLALGADRITFAVDYPYEETDEALEFMAAAPISDLDKEKIYHLNAEKLFKL